MSEQGLGRLAQRLDPLTSLRFFAAAMIVIHHSNALGFFRFSDDPLPVLRWDQGVSFFFVLSGFILTYVYPKLETGPDIRRFWRSRVARVWPAVVASLLLAYWLLSLRWDSRTALANILLVNAWIPLPSYFFSYNSPSWSISTEFGFYLVFPFLIHQWDKTWRAKLFFLCATVVALILVSHLLGLPGYRSMEDGITSDALVYISPLARIFEFVLGMFVGSCYLRQAGDVRWGKIRASTYELGAILLVGLFTSVYCNSPISSWVKSTLGSSASQWHGSSGSMFAFCLLIYVLAIGRGWASSWLSHPLMVGAASGPPMRRHILSDAPGGVLRRQHS